MTGNVFLMIDFFSSLNMLSVILYILFSKPIKSPTWLRVFFVHHLWSLYNHISSYWFILLLHQVGA